VEQSVHGRKGLFYLTGRSRGSSGDVSAIAQLQIVPANSTRDAEAETEAIAEIVGGDAVFDSDGASRPVRAGAANGVWELKTRHTEAAGLLAD
jgi:hypothetical protein